MSNQARDLMKKLSGIDREEKKYLQALWTLHLGLERAISNCDLEIAKTCIDASQNVLDSFEEFITEHIELYEPLATFKLGKDIVVYTTILFLFSKTLEQKKIPQDLEKAGNVLASITRIILGEEDEETN